MTLWFLRGLLRRVVTTRYPARPEPSTAPLPTPPRLRADLLTGPLVDALIDVCPSGAFRRDGPTFIYDVGACTACGRCYPVAGAAARPSGVLELAATSRDQLVKRIPIADEKVVIT